jgi:hypothetical protein
LTSFITKPGERRGRNGKITFSRILESSFLATGDED